MTSFTKILKEVFFLGDFSEEEIELIAGYAYRESFKKNEIIFKEGAQADKLCIILSGKINIYKGWENNKGDLLAMSGAGNMVGEMSLIDNLPRSATVIASENTEVLSINQDDFSKILDNNKKLALQIMKNISSKVRKSNETFVEGLRLKNKKLVIANKNLMKAQEELLKNERLSNLGKFSSMIIHDIRNPISLLKGFAEMILLNIDSKDKVKKSAEKIIKQASRLNNFAEELLDYSRGEIRLNISIVSPDSFFSLLDENIRPLFELRNINVNFNIKTQEPILMDQERMLRVITNISSNAKKAMSENGNFVIKLEKDNNKFIFTIKDDGVGMEKDVLDRIFEPFYSSSGKGGVGLGMLVVKNVVEAHDGFLDIKSAPNKGTIVKIVLPAKL